MGAVDNSFPPPDPIATASTAPPSADIATDFWRLRTTLLPEAAARDLCARLRAEGVDCVPVVD